MKTNINRKNDQAIIKEVFDILKDKLETDKIIRFWTICNLNPQDYCDLKDQLFQDETVDSLYEKIKNYEKENKS
ncbi:hypothetical protein [Geminocystis herdmanii]|uniref:hypothetical protein n=1 Tax=Geminocystis herdmanii TaxID=669359 RepID=UPI0003495A13|nr:hypothetical protein [Geminocystis herdmanii]